MNELSLVCCSWQRNPLNPLEIKGPGPACCVGGVGLHDLNLGIRRHAIKDHLIVTVDIGEVHIEDGAADMENPLRVKTDTHLLPTPELIGLQPDTRERAAGDTIDHGRLPVEGALR